MGWFSIASALLASSVALQAEAQSASPAYTLGEPIVFGSGCPKGSVFVIKSFDQQSFSVLYSQFQAHTDPQTLASRKSCNMALEIKPSPGIAVGLIRTDYRGFVYVPDEPRTGLATFSSEYFFAGKRGQRVRRSYRAGTFDEIYESTETDISPVIWTECGESATFRVNTAIMARKRRRDDGDVEVMIDSTDAMIQSDGPIHAQFENGAQVFVTYKQC